ncbi:MAG: preprotein translocase subunit SecE [Oscillospiraceae bacterium]|jgi:preprotein translocase subunit SecE|nr:preprotein translocase subunit SecE [Oscillospiraceae bacterium]
MVKSSVSTGKRNFFSDLRYEFKKVTWPTRKVTMGNVGTVLSSVFLIGLFVFLLDWGFFYLLNLCMKMV